MMVHARSGAGVWTRNLNSGEGHVVVFAENVIAVPAPCGEARSIVNVGMVQAGLASVKTALALASEAVVAPMFLTSTLRP